MKVVAGPDIVVLTLTREGFECGHLLEQPRRVHHCDGVLFAVAKHILRLAHCLQNFEHFVVQPYLIYLYPTRPVLSKPINN